MTALTKDKAVGSRAGTEWADPVAAGMRIYRGALVALDAAGHAVPGGDGSGVRIRGLALYSSADNSAGSAGDARIETRSGEAFFFVNSDGADEITRAEIGSDVFVVDDQTVAKTDGGGARILAGTCVQIAENGVWVKL